MAPQHVEIAETLAAVKRALRRGKEAPIAQPITAASNRGKKLEQGAKYVHEGSLSFTHGPDVYKQKIEHAGFTRYILERNPRRYNEYGDELEDSESDQEADADAADENAYSSIRLEELLSPLKHPSELPIHPTMSHAYLSNALSDMVKTTQNRLRQERANLWRAKRLNQELIGDQSWMPCEAVESAGDWDIFEPRKNPHQATEGTKKRKREQRSTELIEEPGADVMMRTFNASDITETATTKEVFEPSTALLTGHPAAEDVGMPDSTEAKTTQPEGRGDENGEGSEDLPHGVEETNEDMQMNGADHSANDLKTNGTDLTQTHEVNGEDHTNTMPEEEISTKKDAQPENTNGTTTDHPSKPSSEADEATPPPPPRRITRALAATNTSNPHSNAPTPPLSPTPTLASSSDSSLLQIDPLFLLPPSVQPLSQSSALYGLPAEEASETRRLLTTYIQKQEESVRGYEAVLAKLLKAQRLRMEVLDMCKAEGHIGEMSDGEDWIDTEEWGLQPGELRKGRDEDEDAVEENTIGGRKGKRRGRN